MAATWTRRRLIKAAFLSTLGAGAAGGAAALIGFLYPRKTDDKTPGGVVVIASSAVPRAGESPLAHRAGGFHLVNLKPGEGLNAESTSVAPGGLLALSSKCTHLSCTAEWEDGLSFQNGVTAAVGAFACRCHDSFFTKAGLRIGGPAPRSLDTLVVEVTGFGDVSVNPSAKRVGDVDNPGRAVPWTPPS